VWASLLVLGFLGCGRKPTVAVLPASTENLQKIANAYRLATDNLGVAPRSLDDLLPALKQLGYGPEVLKSPDDGEDYVIVWGVDYRYAQGNPVLAYERRGRDGIRLVNLLHFIVPVSPEDFKKLSLPPGHQTPP